MQYRKTFTPIIHGVISGALALNLWYLSSVAIDKNVTPSDYSKVIDVSLVLIGAFIAYLFRLIEKNLKEKRDQKAVLNKALATYLRQIQILSELKDDFKDHKDKHDEKRALETIPYELPEYSGVKQDIEQLDFLIEMQHADTYLQVSISQEAFDQVINAVKARSAFFDNHVIPGLIKVDEQGLVPNIKNLREALGMEKFKRLVHLTNEMYTSLDHNANVLNKNIDRLFCCSKSIFPDHAFIYFKEKTPPTT